MMTQIRRLRRYGLAALLVLLAAVTARAQAPEFSYWERTPLPQQGLATYYNPGIMEQVLDYRLAAGDIDACPDCVGTVALLRAGDIGRKVWLQPPGGDPVGPFLVVDCARREDVPPLLDRNWVVDVSYEVGQYWGMVRPLDGVIVFEDPADLVPGRSANRIPTPFSVAPADIVISPPTPTPLGPALPENAPTPWPTRMPVPLAPLPGSAALPPEPTVTPVLPTATAIWPPPKTPIVTTPTPVASVTPDEGSGSVGGITGVDTLPTEVARGRAGGDLLAGSDGLALSAGGTATATARYLTRRAPTARPTLARTPRVNLTPILPAVSTPTPTPAAEPGWLDRILQGLWNLIR